MNREAITRVAGTRKIHWTLVLGAGLVGGLLFGAGMSLWATAHQASGMTHRGARRMPTNSTVHQRWRLAVAASPAQVLSAARAALEARQ